jgi:hypothetical protein
MAEPIERIPLAAKTFGGAGARSWQLWGRAGWAQVRAVGNSVVTRARAWRVHLAAPGLAGAALVSAAAGMRFGTWAGLLAAGLFCLRLDARL